MTDAKEDCSTALANSVVDHIRSSSLPLTLEFKPGVKTVRGTSLEMGTLGNYTLCFQAIIEYRVCIFLYPPNEETIKLLFEYIKELSIFF